MKKLYALLPILAALVAPGKASAQMLPDSTVQIVAYWEVGDQVAYSVETKKYNVDDEGNETPTGVSSEIMQFNVVDATDSTYTLELTYTLLSDPDMEKIIPLEELNTKFSPVYRFKTDELGTFLRLENLDEIAAMTQGLRPYIKNSFLKELDTDSENSAISGELLEKLVDNTVDAVMLAMSPQMLESSFVSDVNSLLFYHGSKLDTTVAYSYTKDMASILNGVLDGVDGEAEGMFWVNSQYTDEDSAVLESTLEVGTEQLGQAIRQYLNPVISAFVNGIEEVTEEEAQAAAAEAFETASMEVRQEGLEIIHLGSGWPLACSIDTYVTFKVMDQEGVSHVEKTFRVVEPDK